VIVCPKRDTPTLTDLLSNSPKKTASVSTAEGRFSEENKWGLLPITSEGVRILNTHVPLVCKKGVDRVEIFPVKYRSTRTFIMIDRFPSNLELFDVKNQVMVALWPNYVWYPISLHGGLHWAYFAEKFNVGEVDAKVIVEVLTKTLREKYGGTCVAVDL
jgi:hypothetical protein